MRIFSVRPTAVLMPFIDRVWGWETSSRQSINLPIVLPGTGADLFFHYGRPFTYLTAGKRRELGTSHLFCVRHRPLELEPSRDIGFIAIRFRAGCLHGFTTLPPRELLDATVSTHELWGPAGRTLEMDVLNAPSKEAASDRLQRFLIERLETGHQDPLVAAAVSKIYSGCDCIPIDRLAASLNVTRRELERRFQLAIGQRPVEVRSLSRMQKVIREVLLNPARTLPQAALSLGYYDQAHFIRAFAKLGLGSPQHHLNTARTRSHFYNKSWTTSPRSDIRPAKPASSVMKL